jgi:alpha-1,6-mannosyltransferase
VNGFGFDDEARPRRPLGRARKPDPTPFDPLIDEPEPKGAHVGILFGLLALVVLAVSAWAYAARVHADDEVAFANLNSYVIDFERDFLPFGQGKRPPCGITDDGWYERTWSIDSSVTLDELDQYALQHGWVRAGVAAGPNDARTFTRRAGDGADNGDNNGVGPDDDHVFTLRLEPPQGDHGVRLTATSEASAFGCLFR